MGRRGRAMDERAGQRAVSARMVLLVPLLSRDHRGRDPRQYQVARSDALRVSARRNPARRRLSVRARRLGYYQRQISGWAKENRRRNSCRRLQSRAVDRAVSGRPRLAPDDRSSRLVHHARGYRRTRSRRLQHELDEEQRRVRIRARREQPGVSRAPPPSVREAHPRVWLFVFETRFSLRRRCARPASRSKSHARRNLAPRPRGDSRRRRRRRVHPRMRMGPDVSPFWGSTASGAGDPSTVYALDAIIARSFMHRRLWLNDPDCLMLRARDTSLSADERAALAATIAASGGMLLISDDMSLLDAEAGKLFRAVTQIAAEIDSNAAREPVLALDLMATGDVRGLIAETATGGAI